MMSNPYKNEATLKTNKGDYKYYSLKTLEENGYKISKLPFSIRILLENALRNFDDFGITKSHIETLLNWSPKASDKDIPYKPARVLMQDFTGVPAVVDIASLRAEMDRKGKDPNKINPLVPVDLVIDHSVQVDYFGTSYSYQKNVEVEYERNGERYQFLKWAQHAFENFSVVPPGMGICHQVNLENLAKGVITRDGMIFPDTLVGTDSHTPMVNGIGVVGWGVGGIEAEAALLGQPIYFIMPQVIGLRLSGSMPLGTTATDLVLTITHLLRSYGVVGKFVEVFGPGLNNLTIPDRATISNMSPEFGCTISYFPIDDQTLDYMEKTNRSEDHIKTVEQYCKANMLWRENEDEIVYSDVLELDLNSIKPTISGPKRPQDKILLENLKPKFEELLKIGFEREYIPLDERDVVRWKSEGGGQTEVKARKSDLPQEVEVEKVENKLKTVSIKIGNEKYEISDGSIAIAAITSCTNTSNPSVMIGAGLVARKAVQLGLDVKPWVKTSLAPGSKVVTDYLKKSGLLEDLEALKFHTVGYGCTSCIGNSGPLPAPISKAVEDYNLVVCSALSGNRNFEARVHPLVKMNFLMSPMLVVAFALAGRIDIDMAKEPLGYDPNMNPVFLKDIWPSNEEIFNEMKSVLTPKDYEKNYNEIFDGNEIWRELKAPEGKLYDWSDKSTYIKEAPFFLNISEDPKDFEDIIGAKVLLKLGDSITTDHISPAGSFKKESAAGQYLINRGVNQEDFNSYGSRRGNDEVMVRGTFANVRINNQLAKKEGGYTTHLPSGDEMTIFEASQLYKKDNTPLIVIGGKEYGSGSSRDWAAKGTFLLGIKAVIAESYERIHRSNLVGMGVLPLQFKEGDTPDSLNLNGTETYDITGISDSLSPLEELNVKATKDDGSTTEFKVICRLDSQIEVAYYQNDGILQYVLRQFLKE
ncbi:aconitate hydratase AcnA [Marinigracilibium pacificum]|uniref:Aconitate hydratase n=1 Tax=Marinigracilibium pacificum TaxID=2729599 RepID=A0A848J1M8_9BACT|nr:aconitate hydratase AcnA [Marinigracilibium pacificum]NMM48440.1 aconitate hydratase AcnA [Marinigracilibium pacificum]